MISWSTAPQSLKWHHWLKLAQVHGGANYEFSHPSTNIGRQEKARTPLCIQLHANATDVYVALTDQSPAPLHTNWANIKARRIPRVTAPMTRYLTATPSLPSQGNPQGCTATRGKKPCRDHIPWQKIIHLKHALHLLIVHPHGEKSASSNTLTRLTAHKRAIIFSPQEFISRRRNRRLANEKTHGNSCESNTTGARRKAKRHWVHSHAHTQCWTHTFHIPNN